MTRNFSRTSFFCCFLILAIFVCSSVRAQNQRYVVTGKVLDGTTGVPLSGASVFAQNTTFGSVTDEEGRFSLNLPEGGYSLVVTFTGYETETVRISRSIAEEGALSFAMQPKIKALDEVQVVITNEVANGWEKYGEFFVNNFIGVSQFAKLCILKNPEVLRFFYSKKHNRLKVLADEPLIVDNFALGYTITFAIDSFVNEYNSNTGLFTVQPLFKEMAGTTPQKKMWEANRETAYKGSMLQFFRSLYQRQLTEDGFEIQFIVKKDGKEIPLKVSNAYGALNYQMDDSTATLSIRPNQPELAVIYNQKPEQAYLDSDTAILAKKFQLSTLTFSNDMALYVEQNGYYYPQQDLITNGYLAFKKAGDLLPYNYGIAEEAEPAEATDADDEEETQEIETGNTTTQQSKTENTVTFQKLAPIISRMAMSFLIF